MFDLPPQLAQCAPDVSPVLMHALVRTESSWKPFAIGPDSGQAFIKQPNTKEEAVRTAKALHASGARFSVGLAQIHMSNITSRGLTWEQAFDPCRNLQLGQTILFDFYRKAVTSGYTGVDAVWAALRGYNSGGVHRTVSDKYARKIFTYMQGPAKTPAAESSRRTTPASTDPQFSQMAGTVRIKATDVQMASPAARALAQGEGLAMESSGEEAAQTDTKRPYALRQGESADIFQMEGEQQGF